MPVQLVRLRATGAVFWQLTCETCGGDAPFGYDVRARKGLSLIAEGKRDEGYRWLGTWYCGQHRPDRPAPAPAAEPQIEGALF